MKTATKRLLSFTLVLAFVASLFSVLSTSAFAESEGNVFLDKKATLEDDGTYTIDLTGYVTGHATTTQQTSYAPLDVVLVLDASSSMMQFSNPVSSYHATNVDTKYTTTNYSYSGRSYPAGTTAETNLTGIDAFHAAKYFNPSNKDADADGTFEENSSIKASYIIPVKPGDEIYCSSFQAKGKNGSSSYDGIRVTYFKEDGTFHSSVGPAAVYKEFNANDLSFIVVPDGAYSMSVAFWENDTQFELRNRSLVNKYRPENEEQFNNMRAKVLQEQVQAFADALAANAKKTGQTHKLAIVTFGGGDTGTGRSQQGHYSKYGGVNGIHGYYFTNTGLFVNGQFKNYMEKEHVDNAAGKTYPAYTPIFRKNVSTDQEYYYMKTDMSTTTDDATGENLGLGVNDGEFRKLTYDSTETKWKDYKGNNIYSMAKPYDQIGRTQFYTMEQVAVSRPTNSDYRNALESILDESGKFSADVQFAIDRYVARGTTHTKYGLAMANNILAQNPPRTYKDALGNEYQGNQVVILFTDGNTNNPAPDADGNPTYNTIFDRANDIKDKGAKLYTISVGEAVDLKWMDQISSNYSNHKDYDDTLALSDGQYYKNNADITLLDEFFTSITSDIISSQTSVELDESAKMEDYLAEGLILPEDFGFENIKVSTVGVTTEDEITYTEIENTKVVFNPPAGAAPSSQATGDYSFTYTQDGVEKTKTLSVSYDKSNGKISVTGFDYAENYVAREHDGRKLVVQITGVEATQDTKTDVLFDTNTTGSGIIYTTTDNEIIFYPFEVPKTQLASKTYVMDYAKPMTVPASDWGGAELHGVASVERLKCEDEITIVTSDYGTLRDNGDHTVTFTPKNMKWGEAAVFYALCDLGQGNAPAGVTTGDNQWVRITIVPANNIYYEDDFLTEDTADGRVGIRYTGNWQIDGTTENSTENPEGAAGDADGVHGWQSTLVDPNYSDGFAHWGDVDPGTETDFSKYPTAEASFSFIGTGVDIYSRTTNSAGTVLVTLEGSKLDSTGQYAEYSKVLIVDNQSVSGDYYQIPTVSFMDLPYDTYTVTLRVTTAAAGRFIYYLDGIRVYNPLTDDSFYADAEKNAVFKEIRDLLAATQTDGTKHNAVFIDKTENETVGAVKDYDTTEYGLYGPKNEVYLAKNQSITFKVNPAGAYYVGLKSPNLEKGVIDEPKAVGKAYVSFGDTSVQALEIGHSTDLYYTVVPDANGYITIQNTGDGLLSVTKLRTAGTQASGEISIISDDDAIEALKAFSMRSVIGQEEDPTPEVVPTAYYLVGYINGADYGCEADHMNMGQYKFENGTLTTTFDVDSYVFLKTEGNTAWYMANAYCTDTTVILYNTSNGSSEKMFVPGGVEVTFTLTENDDGSLTLSYCVAACTAPDLNLYYPTLTFEDVITINVYFSASDIQNVVEMGLITYASEVDQWNVDNAEEVLPGYIWDEESQLYITSTNGIPAKKMGDLTWFAVYAKTADGQYTYTKLVSYSPATYAYNQLNNPDMRDLVVAMLNYGAAAQTYFNYNTDSLMNGDLTDEQKVSIETYRADMMAGISTPGADKAANFLRTDAGFTKRYPTVSFEGAFAINYLCQPSAIPAGDITLYYWNQADYDAADVLSVSNATGTLPMQKSADLYVAAVEGIAAKNLDKGVYVALVYSDGINTYCSGILGYSIGAYCVSQASANTAMASLAEATAVYGYYAKWRYSYEN